MKIGIMQPYFVPYIGYWQLMNAVDKYVVYDDVCFIKKGWINRNRILIDKIPKYINIPLSKASQNKKINEMEISRNTKIIRKDLKTIESVYKKAPYYKEVYPLVEKIINCTYEKFISYIENSFSIICDYLDIETERILSSSLDKDITLKGQEQILDICKILNATEYYNAVGGQQLYDYDAFENRGIKLKFIERKQIEYKQFDNIFQPDLSIIDVMMFNSKKEIHDFLNQYTIIEKKN